MGMMDSMSGDMSAMRARYDELRSREQDGTLDDAGRAELDRLRTEME